MYVLVYIQLLVSSSDEAFQVCRCFLNEIMIGGFFHSVEMTYGCDHLIPVVLGASDYIYIKYHRRAYI